MELKQVILVRQDLKLSKGKMSAQVAHASLEAAMKSRELLVDEWREQGGKKVVLKVKDQKQLFLYRERARDAGLTTVIIKDAGHTAVPAGTVTCIGIGPDEEKKIDKVTGKLKMV